MATLAFSSTKPDAFDTRAIAVEKWTQINNGNKLNVNVTSTVTISPTGDEVADTRTLTLEKIIQSLE